MSPLLDMAWHGDSTALKLNGAAWIASHVAGRCAARGARTSSRDAVAAGGSWVLGYLSDDHLTGRPVDAGSIVYRGIFVLVCVFLQPAPINTYNSFVLASLRTKAMRHDDSINRHGVAIPCIFNVWHLLSSPGRRITNDHQWLFF